MVLLVVLDTQIAAQQTSLYGFANHLLACYSRAALEKMSPRILRREQLGQLCYARNLLCVDIVPYQNVYFCDSDVNGLLLVRGRGSYVSNMSL